MKQNTNLFSHDLFGKKVADIFETYETTSSFVVSINGSWGTGKTNLMNQVINYLNKENYIKISFNAWRYFKKEDIWRALLVSIIDACKDYIEDERNVVYLGWNKEDIELIQDLLEETEKALYTAFVKESPGEISVDTSNLLKTGVNMAMKFVPWGNLGNEILKNLLTKKDENGKNISSTFEEEDVEQLWGIFTRSSTKRSIEKIVGVEQFRKKFEVLLRTVLKGEYECDNRKLIGHNRNVKLVVAIDDLDRCLPENVLEILEAIKLFVDYPNTYFMIAMDSNIVQQGLDIRYNSLSIRAKDYCEKMIDLSFNIPYILESNFPIYIKKISKYSDIYIELLPVLDIALKSNLRAWERYIYRADFFRDILETLEENLFEDIAVLKYFLKTQCFSYQWPEIYKVLGSENIYISLEHLIKDISSYEQRDMEYILKYLEEKMDKKEVLKFIKEKAILDFLYQGPCAEDVKDKDKIQLIFTLDKMNFYET